MPEGTNEGENLREQEQREGNDLMDAAARGAGLTATEENALLDYFLGDAPAPNSGEELDLAVTIRREERDGETIPVEWPCTVRAIDWGEWQDSQKRGVDSEGSLDIFVQSSWVVARALKKPLLGAMLKRIQEEKPEAAPQDAAALLRRFFAKQPGSLIYIQRRVLELSKLDEMGQGGVREVEASKNSS